MVCPGLCATTIVNRLCCLTSTLSPGLIAWLAHIRSLAIWCHERITESTSRSHFGLRSESLMSMGLPSKTVAGASCVDACSATRYYCRHLWSCCFQLLPSTLAAMTVSSHSAWSVQPHHWLVATMGYRKYSSIIMSIIFPSGVKPRSRHTIFSMGHWVTLTLLVLDSALWPDTQDSSWSQALLDYRFWGTRLFPGEAASSLLCPSGLHG